MRFWDTNDANGKPITDGRICLVIRNDQDSTMPDVRIYGRDKEEVLDKAARTVETAQSEIHRLRTKPAPPVAAPAPTPRVTADEQARATADLGDPSKSPDAVRVLLRAAGVDVDQMKLREDAERVANIAQNWEREHPDFPHDPRNQRQLMNTAALRAGGMPNITTAILDAAYAELVRTGMLFEAAPESEETVLPDGSPEPRTVRTATSYRSNALRTPVPVVQVKPKYTRAQVDAMNSRQIREKIETEPGFSEWFNKEFAAKSA